MNGICPLLSIADANDNNYTTCMGRDCEWWVAYEGTCVIKSLYFLFERKQR